VTASSRTPYWQKDGNWKRYVTFTWAGNGNWTIKKSSWVYDGPKHRPGSGTGGYPIALDLDMDGVELVDLTDSQTFMDIDGDGNLEHLGWVSSDDGLLIFDANENGQVDDWSEVSFIDDLEGAQTDLEGLAAHDSNNDGIINEHDESFELLKVWQDLNSDGIQQEGELFSLNQKGITEINLESDGVIEQIGDNTSFGTGSFEMNGKSQALLDVAVAAVSVSDMNAINGNTGNDALFGTQEADLIADNKGNNYNGDDQIVTGSGHDAIEGGAGSDLILSGAGNDYINAGNGDDVVEAGAGNDHITTGLGNDLLNGEAGNDYLIGGNGNDNYLFAKGFGQDVIDERGNESDTDELFFDEDIALEDLYFERVGNDLTINVLGTEDTLTILNQFGSKSSGVESINVGGLSVIDNDIALLTQAMTSMGEPDADSADFSVQRDKMFTSTSKFWRS